MPYDPSKDQNHVHRFTISSVKNTFDKRPDGSYDMNEWAILLCQCPYVIKVPVNEDTKFDIETFLSDRHS